MRLERLTIGGPLTAPAHHFKNLKNVTLDFDAEHWITVAIGWNGTGKSNILEALAIIFREFMTAKKPDIPFAFEMVYRMGEAPAQRRIRIQHNPDYARDRYKIYVQKNIGMEDTNSMPRDEESREILGERLSVTAFKSDQHNLPRYVFSYYSGEGTRLQEIFTPYLEKYDSDLRAGRDPGLKKLFYAMPAHSQFVLLAFLIHQDIPVRQFLNDHLGIDPDNGIESVLFVLREPPWHSTAPEGDRRFWNARGIVQQFLSRLYEASLAPIETQALVPVSLWNKKTLGFKYLYLKDIAALRELVAGDSPAKFFRDLESTYVSQLIDEVRIKVRLKSNDNAVTFRELSEGEQQLLTVLGLLRFTAEEESLFLLDEPDTHLNPQWSVDYLKYLELFLGINADEGHTSHVLLTTHNAIAIAGLEREQVQVLARAADREIYAQHPAVSPRGMGYAGVVTSDMFGLGSSLDKETSKDLIRLHTLANQESLSAAERRELQTLRSGLDELDFNFASRDRLEQEFRRARFDLSTDTADAIVTPENKDLALTALVESLLGNLEDDVP
jgi:predicted ATPase